jgi:hypothetical protein
MNATNRVIFEGTQPADCFPGDSVCEQVRKFFAADAGRHAASPEACTVAGNMD